MGVKLWMVVGGGDKIMLIVGGGGKIMPGREWQWEVATKLWLVVAGCGWSRQVVDGCGWSHDLVMPFVNTKIKSEVSG